MWMTFYGDLGLLVVIQLTGCQGDTLKVGSTLLVSPLAELVELGGSD